MRSNSFSPFLSIKTFSASYDAVGHLITSTNPDAAYTYSYDAVDRVTSIDNTGTVGVPAVKFNYGYDAVGNLLSVNDSINGTNAGITGYTYDLLNRVTKLTQGGTGVQSKRVDMAYNAVNQLTGLSRFSGVNGVVDTSYTYDNNQRLIQLSHKKGASTVASYDYGYDAADKLASTVSSVDGTSNYSYDATNQLTGTDHSSQTDEAYSYDANGNRTSGGTVTGVNNQLLNDGTYSYTYYDGEGNRTKRTEISTGKVTEYVWDYRNRLASVLFKDAGGSVTKTIDYIYDGNNQRIGKRIDGAVVERYVIDRNQIALVFDGAGVQTHRYLYGTAVDQVLSDETPTGMVWALADNQGTVKDLVDNSGVVVNHVSYDSFGRVVAQSNAGVEFRYGYTGREQDAETGLDYYRARYYDASNGRFISEDPIGFNGGDSNLNRYVGNSPVNFVDPSGLEPVKIQAGTINIFTQRLRQSNFGKSTGKQSEDQLIGIAQTVDYVPTRLTPVNNSTSRYIYTAKGGWIDMSHFFFYAGRARQIYNNKLAFPYFREKLSISECAHDGFNQEMSDLVRQPHSAFSYEDLPSDFFGAVFATQYFNPESKDTLAEQISKFFKEKLGALNPEDAPNYNQIPERENSISPATPIWKNYTTIPMFTKVTPIFTDEFSR